mmetsp:Transcript_15791/g.40241  ORF Transcript_15791/g.40241 Transcript_15791/m.40241 type:complete len:362 (-) Transcript_15791:841-1926(-)
MWHRTILAEVQVPLVFACFEACSLHLFQKDIVPLLPLCATYEFPHARHQHVHGRHGFVVLVQLHVESLNSLGVVVDYSGTLEVLLRQEPFVLTGQVATPENLVLEFLLALAALCLDLQDCHSLGVRDAGELALCYGLHSGQGPLVDHSVHEGHILAARLQQVRAAEPHVILGAVHQVLQAREGDFGLYHPELSRVPGGVGIFCAEGRSKGVDLGEGTRIGLPLQLPGHGQEGLQPEEVVLVVDDPLGRPPEPVGVVPPELGLLRLGLERHELSHQRLDARLLVRILRVCLARGLGLLYLRTLGLARLGKGGEFRVWQERLVHEVVGGAGERRHLEALARTLGVGRRDDGCMQVQEAVLLEE